MHLGPNRTTTRDESACGCAEAELPWELPSRQEPLSQIQLQMYDKSPYIYVWDSQLTAVCRHVPVF